MPPTRTGCEVSVMFRAVLLDMDGLMLDTERRSLGGWAHAAEVFGLSLPTDLMEAVVGANQRRMATLMEEVFGPGFDFAAFAQVRDAYTWEDYRRNGIPLKKGLPELLDYLEEKGSLRAVVTSSHRERADRCLELSGLTGRFDAVVCGDGIPRPKPAPDIYQKAAEILGCRAHECPVLEDSPVGLTAARRAGMRALLIPDLIQPSRPIELLADARLDSLEQVIPFLEACRELPDRGPADQVLRALLRRRSVRAFTGESVGPDALELILRAGMAAPSARDTRPWRFVVTERRPLLEQLRAALPHGGALETAAAAVVLCARPEGAVGRDDYWEQDCGAAAENMLLAASALGLGGVWLGVWPRRERCAALADLLDLPEALTPFCVLAFGHPAEDGVSRDRYDPGLVCWDRWGLCEGGSDT